MSSRYEIHSPATRNRNGSLEKEPTGKLRVLTVDRSQMRFRSLSMTISREISSEKEFDVVEERISQAEFSTVEKISARGNLISKRNEDVAILILQAQSTAQLYFHNACRSLPE